MKRNKTVQIVYIALCTAIISVCSWITVPVGAVPITLQTLAVCLVSALFGVKIGTLSVISYIFLGALGLPVFSSFRGGLGVLFGATGGYIFGFILTALIVGYIGEKYAKRLFPLILTMLLGILVCYAFGTAWFALVYVKNSESMAFSSILGACVLPFILPDAVKAVLAALLTLRLKRYIGGKNEIKTQEKS